MPVPRVRVPGLLDVSVQLPVPKAERRLCGLGLQQPRSPSNHSLERYSLFPRSEWLVFGGACILQAEAAGATLVAGALENFLRCIQILGRRGVFAHDYRLLALSDQSQTPVSDDEEKQSGEPGQLVGCVVDAGHYAIAVRTERIVALVLHAPCHGGDQLVLMVLLAAAGLPHPSKEVALHAPNAHALRCHHVAEGAEELARQLGDVVQPAAGVLALEADLCACYTLPPSGLPGVREDEEELAHLLSTAVHLATLGGAIDTDVCTPAGHLPPSLGIVEAVPQTPPHCMHRAAQGVMD